MYTTRMARSAAAMTLAAALTACASYRPPFPIPDEPGLYALTPNSELQRLDGDQKWEVKTWPERANLSPHTEFVILDPDLASDSQPAPERFEIYRVALVRSEIGSNNLAMPITGNSWVVARIAPLRVPFRIERAPRTPEAVHIIPASLEPGLYSLRLNGNGVAHEARLGVQWDAVDKRQYSAANCVDRYTAQGTSYKTCTGQGGAMPAISTEGLEITLVDPLRNGNHLVVQGVVTNTTDQTKPLPALQVILQDQSGQELSRHVVQPRVAELGPGKRLPFRAEVLRPIGPAKVRVAFVTDTTAGVQ
jgi:hypothetical protein